MPGLKVIPTTKLEAKFGLRSPLCQSRRVGGEGLGVRIRIPRILSIYGFRSCPHPCPLYVSVESDSNELESREGERASYIPCR